MTLLERLHARAAGAPASGIVAVMNHGHGLDGVIPLWAGEGDLATPRFIADAAAASLAAGETFYTWQRGIPELREALGRYASGLYGRPLAADRFFVTGSGMHAIQLAIAILAGDGDEVVHVGPGWPNFAAAVGVAGARPREVALDWTQSGWRLDLDRLRDALTGRTRALFVNTPANPTGWTASRETLAAILDLARERNVAIVADEIYSRFHYGGEGGRAPSFHDVMEGDDEPVFFVNSFSKNWAMTGWRVGWIEAPAEFGPVIENLVQYSNSGVAAFMQRGAVAALEGGEDFVASQVRRARQARDLFCDALLTTNRVALTPPEGAFYAFFAIDGVADTREAAFRLLDEARVGLAPGTAFGASAPRFMRACFHRRLDQVEEAAGRLAQWIGKR